MTNQEAIKLLSMGRLAYNDVEAEAFCEAYEMAIKALKAEPCDDNVYNMSAGQAYDKGFDDGLEQGLKIGEPCADCVSRADVLEKLHELLDPLEDGEDICPVDIFNEIDVLPSVTPAQKTGKWLNIELIPDEITGHVHGECSECGKVRIVDNYCPNCGAKMSEEV